MNFRNISFIIFTSALLMTASQAYGQAEKKYIRKGNSNYKDGKYSESETFYRRAIDKDKTSEDAIFNVGDALYKQKKYEEASKQFQQNVEMTESKQKKSAGLYNMGNSFLKANKLEQSIDAYKNALKLDPDNMEAKYNLAYAQDLLQQQQQQKQQNNDKNKQDKNQQDKDKQQQNQDKQNQDKQQQDRQNEQNQQNREQQQQQQQQNQEQQISKEDAERILNALANEEKDVQEKVKKEKAAAVRVGTVKNW